VTDAIGESEDNDEGRSGLRMARHPGEDPRRRDGCVAWEVAIQRDAGNFRTDAGHGRLIVNTLDFVAEDEVFDDGTRSQILVRQQSAAGRDDEHRDRDDEDAPHDIQGLQYGSGGRLATGR